jgi:RNA polymerase sigma factor (sigma-70 family)
VSLLATKRKLSSEQYDELLNFLEQAGVDLPDLTSSRSLKATMQGNDFLGDSIGHYLREIGRYPLIGAAREVELWSLIAQGEAAQQELDAMGEDESAPGVRRSLRNRVEAGRLAHAELVCANLRLVVFIAKARHYDTSGVAFADRIQEGNLGLMHAASKFDGSKGFKFSTYATWWVKQAIDRGIGNQGRLIRIPVHVHEQVQKVRRAVSKLTARLDREPTLTEISQMADMDPGKVQSMLDLMQPIRSLDALLGHEGDLHLSDVLVSEEERDGRTDPAEIVIHATFRSDVARALRAHLPERAARVVERRFGLGTGDEETLDDIGADYGVSRERIRQIQGSSMKKLQMSPQVAALRSYLLDDSKAGWSGDSIERKAS